MVTATVNPAETTTVDDDDILTIDEFLALMKISRSHAWRLIHRGEIPHYRLGATVRIPKRELLEALKNKKKTIKSS